MGPKKKEEPPKLTKKQREALALEQALKRAGDDARRNYQQQDRLRSAQERRARGEHDEERFDRAAEVKRLNEEMTKFRKVGDEIVRDRRLALLENSKLTRWQNISECSPLPHPDDEPSIHEFLSMWRDEQTGIADLVPQRLTHEIPNRDTRVLIKRVAQPAGSKDPFTTTSLTAQHDDFAASADFRRDTVEYHLNQCVRAVQLVHNIQIALDESHTRNKKELIDMHTRHQVEINEAILEALDSITCVVLHHLDYFFDPEEESVVRIAPQNTSNPAIRFGLWMRGEKSRVNVAAIRYSELQIAIEPKDAQTLKVPKALGLQTREDVAIRAIQFNFDPLSILTPPSVGQEFYALDCVVVLESLTAPAKPKKVAEWTCRVEQVGGSRELHRNEYPPKTEKERSTSSSISASAASSGGGGGGGSGNVADSEFTMKVTFEVPDTVAIRTRQPIIGRWNSVTRLWDPCSTARLGGDNLSRKVSFLTSDLTALAVVQEKGFDVPYERWQIYPNRYDEVLFVLEGRHREDTGARGFELRLRVRAQECMLIGSEERELAHIAGRWLPPLTLLRLLSKAGYNFILSDADAEFLPMVLPRTNGLETKAYFDISLFCLTHSFCSSRHNRVVEDPDSALFRVSKEQRPEEQETDEGFPVDADDQSLWHSVRFETERVVVSNFKEDDDVPDLRPLENHESHVNLYTVLQKIYDEPSTGSFDDMPTAGANASAAVSAAAAASGGEHEHGVGGDSSSANVEHLVVDVEQENSMIHRRATSSDPLVQDCLFHLLLLTRPLTWG